MSKVAAVADNDRRVLRKIQCDIVRIALADHEFDPAIAERVVNFGQALEHEGVVALVGFGIGVRKPESDDQALPSFVGGADGVFQSMVEVSTLRLLHPVQHVAAVGIWRIIVQASDAVFFHDSKIGFGRHL